MVDREFLNAEYCDDRTRSICRSKSRQPNQGTGSAQVSGSLNYAGYSHQRGDSMTTRRANAGIIVHGCARCGGDLYRDILEDIRDYEEEYVCLQCGRRTTRSVASGRPSSMTRDRRIVRRTPHSRILE